MTENSVLRLHLKKEGNPMYKNINQNLMTENVKTPRLGVAPQVALSDDLPRKTKYTVDSWFVIGRVEEGGHKLNYLFHIMAMEMPIPIKPLSKKWQVAYSIIDEITGFYYSGDKIYGDKFSAMLMPQPTMLEQPMIGRQNCPSICMKMPVVEGWEANFTMPLKKS